MEILEPCKVVVFGGIKEFRLKLKSLDIPEIKNDNQFIKESDVVLILIEEIDGKFVAENITSLSIFNRIDTKMVTGSEIKDIVYINKQNIQCTEDFKFDFKFDPNKIYYVKAFDEDENEFWLFKPRKERQERLTEHIGCLSVNNGKVDYDSCAQGNIMDNNEIVELREATPSEIKIFLNTVEQWKSLGLKIF
jgi:hypothetical protein